MLKLVRFRSGHFDAKPIERQQDLPAPGLEDRLHHGRGDFPLISIRKQHIERSENHIGGSNRFGNGLGTYADAGGTGFPIAAAAAWVMPKPINSWPGLRSARSSRTRRLPNPPP